MAQRRNLFTKMGRPPAPPKPPGPSPTTRERQAPAPSDGFVPRVPAKAYRGGGKVSYHDDPSMRRK